jgi:hypothetical protein
LTLVARGLQLAAQRLGVSRELSRTIAKLAQIAERAVDRGVVADVAERIPAAVRHLAEPAAIATGLPGLSLAASLLPLLAALPLLALLTCLRLLPSSLALPLLALPLLALPLLPLLAVLRLLALLPLTLLPLSLLALALLSLALLPLLSSLRLLLPLPLLPLALLIPEPLAHLLLERGHTAQQIGSLTRGLGLALVAIGLVGGAHRIADALLQLREVRRDAILDRSSHVRTTAHRLLRVVDDLLQLTIADRARGFLELARRIALPSR